MSKAAKLSIFILIALIVISLGFGGYTLMQKQQLEEVKASLEGQLEQANTRDKKNILKINSLEGEKATLQTDLQNEQKTAEALRREIGIMESDMKSLETKLNGQISKLEQEKDAWQGRIDRITKERDDLLVKLKNVPSQAAIEAKPKPEIFKPASSTSMPSGVDEQYWADILKQKAKLEIEVDRLKDKISEDSIQIVDLRQKNQQLELKLNTLESEKGQIEMSIKEKEELVNRISLELARSKNDRKFEETQIGKFKEENVDLRRQIRDLVSSKNALEKSIIRLTQDKVKMEKKLGQTETIVQSKIDEIWEIKDSLDQSFKTSKVNTQTANEVELPPIVVKTGSQAVNYMPSKEHAGFSGKVVSTNDENNFVIVDIGEIQGLRLGDALSVYRDSKYIARLEVIQVRKDISAADIKDQWSQVRVGDVVR